MSEKVILTQEQAKAIENLTAPKCMDVIHHLNNGWDTPKYNALNDLTGDEFIRALYIGYEVEKTFKKNDWVKVNWQNEKSSIHKVVKDSNGIWVEIDGDQLNKRPTISVVEHASLEEIEKEKQRRWWAGHGRESLEFRENDVVHCQCFNYGGIYIVESNEYGKDAFGNRLVRVYNRHVNDSKTLSFDAKELRIICFAEDRKDIK